MSNETYACESALRLANFPLLHIITAVKIVICISGILTTSLHTKKKGIAWLVHPNAKILYSVHVFWAIYVPTTYFIAFSTDFIRFLLPQTDPCAYTISTVWGVALRALPVLGLVSQSLTMLAFALERIISTSIPVFYEKVKTPILGVILAILAFLGGGNIVYWLILSPINWTGSLPMTAIRTGDNAYSYQLFLSTFIYSEMTTITVFSITLFINYCLAKRKSRRTTSLSNKYQMNENKHLIITLLPCFFVHFLLNITPMVGLKLYYVFFTYELGANMVWVEIWTQAQVYSLLMPIIIELRLKLHRRKEITNQPDTLAHFQQLHSIFNKK